MAIEGYLDTCDADQVRGWAVRHEDPGARLTVKIMAQGKVVGEATADAFRPDLEAAGIGTGKHGFVFTFPAPLSREEAAGVQAYVTSPDGEMAILRRVPVRGFLEVCDAMQARGWAFRDDRPEGKVTVAITRNGVVIGNTVADIYRADLKAGGIGTGDHGFVFNFAEPLTPEEIEQVQARALLDEGGFIALGRLAAAALVPVEQPALPVIGFPGIASDPSHRPVFIVGSARSGTSAMTLGLMASTRYTGHEEGHFVGLLAPLLVDLHKYYVWRSDDHLGRTDTMLSRISQNFMRDAIYHGMIEAARALYPDGLWVEKTPHSNMIHLAPRLREVWPNARFILMRRRAVENIASRSRKFDFDFKYNCEEWASALEAWVSVRDMLGGVALEMDQQFMASEPAEAAKVVGEFLSLEAEEVAHLEQTLATARPQRTGAHFGEVKDIQDMGWQPHEIAIFHELCGPMMREFGYSTAKTHHFPGVWEGARRI
jgi:hypothetical protein